MVALLTAPASDTLALDRTLSPSTGWTRRHWEDLADRLLGGAEPFTSPSRARILFPGAPGGYGSDIDGLEGFARTFMLAAFRIAGDPARTGDLVERYAAGLAAGTDPDSPERWPRPDEVDQAKVEAAAIAIGLHLTRAELWDRLDDRTKRTTIDWLATVIGQPYPPINWVWFRIVVEEFLRTVGGPFSEADLEEDLAIADGFFREDGWFADGGTRAYDHYTGWALHLYPVLWRTMLAPGHPHQARLDRYDAHLDRYLEDAVTLVGANGSPLVQGRSLIYRFAAAAPFWAGAMAGSTALSPGLVRRAASGVVSHFDAAGAPDDRGILTLGWHQEWRQLAQSYSGPGSPYWAAKGMLGLALPAGHPVWTAIEEPLPIERGDVLRTVVAPGWIVSGTTADGIVRVVNHGTDHANDGVAQRDAPLYARLGYSTATAPVLSADARDPFDGSVVLLDAEGVPSHRSGFTRGALTPLPTSDGSSTGWSTSSGLARWIDADADGPDHGHGHAADRTRTGAGIDLCSAVRGPWEVRFVRVVPGTGDEVPLGALRVGGWTVSGRDLTVATDQTSAVAVADRVRSVVVALPSEHDPLPTDALRSGVRDLDDATPLGPRSGTPWCETDGPVRPDHWHAFALLLDGATQPGVVAPAMAGVARSTARTITWPDGATTSLDLPASH